jgi:hypothetical protein
VLLLIVVALMFAITLGAGFALVGLIVDYLAG